MGHHGLVDRMVVKTEVCAFSGLKIYPGHGVTYVRADMKQFKFINSKCRRFFIQRRNPRKLNWTMLYRRMHKKGTVDEVSKRKNKKNVKVQRAIVGADIDAIKAKRNQNPEVRAAARDAALREIKERKK